MDSDVIEKYRELIISGQKEKADKVRESVMGNKELLEKLDVIDLLQQAYQTTPIPEGFHDRQMNFISSVLEKEKKSDSLAEFLRRKRRILRLDTLTASQKIDCAWSYYVDIESGHSIKDVVYESIASTFNQSVKYLKTLKVEAPDLKIIPATKGEAFYRNAEISKLAVKEDSERYHDMWTDHVVSKASDLLKEWYQVDSVKELSLPINVVDIGERIYGFKVEFPETIEENASGASCPDKKIIQILRKESYLERQLFTYAHEMGHLLLHASTESRRFFRCKSKDIHEIKDFFRKTKDSSYGILEAEANLFASEILMPTDLIKQEFIDNKDQDINSLANKFHVSKEAMKWKLHRLRLKDINNKDSLPLTRE